MYFMTQNAFIQIVPGLFLDGQQWDYAIIFKPIKFILLVIIYNLSQWKLYFLLNDWSNITSIRHFFLRLELETNLKRAMTPRVSVFVGPIKIPCSSYSFAGKVLNKTLKLC